ncbi:hypothetical protein HK096_003332 [Nowakowskiella sp. JEL0078]|nr:hypothetical protein HK096_003332 [Nowakowskiella sp. JEL0078]
MIVECIVVGEPIGTSQYFSTKMKLAVQHFLLSKFNTQISDTQITLIAIEGEGKVEERVEIMFKKITEGDEVTMPLSSMDAARISGETGEMFKDTKIEQIIPESIGDPATVCLEKQGTNLNLNVNTKSKVHKGSKTWKQSLDTADLVIFASHSQGTPVTTMLVSRLLDVGILNPMCQRVGILAMAGISHGPFPNLKHNLIVKYFEADAARELFEFNNTETKIAKKYSENMSAVLEAGVKVVAVGSWFDQVVPLYSAVMHAFEHPNIFRAVHIAETDYSPDFLTKLVVFALQLRNSGRDDHGLILNLSEYLAGNLYGFGTQGHATIYEDIATYILGVEWVFSDESPIYDSDLAPHLYSLTSLTSTKFPSFSKENSSEITNTIISFLSNLPFISTLFSKDNQLKPHKTQNQPFDENLIRTTIKGITLFPKMHTTSFSAPLKLNPYYLPWIVSRIISDTISRSSGSNFVNMFSNFQVSSDQANFSDILGILRKKIAKRIEARQNHGIEMLRESLDDLIKSFAVWNPGTKAAKEVKFRLEPLKTLKSKL